ncbi:MAG: glycosyltransferase family 39 protein, partial [Anaerolineae bacterium]|nr:glycosyltransferase family 39 protein [Anaerolineae bacterium]
MTESLTSRPYYQFWLLLLIILIGTALRFLYLGQQSIWYDEAVSLAIADRLSIWDILANRGESSHPPLYYLLLHVWTRWVPINDFSARFLSALAGTLTIPVIYLVGCRLVDRRLGLWSALLIAVFPFHIYYAQEARMYTLLALLTTLSLLFFLEAIKHNRWRAWAAYWI